VDPWCWSPPAQDHPFDDAASTQFYGVVRPPVEARLEPYIRERDARGAERSIHRAREAAPHRHASAQPDRELRIHEYARDNRWVGTEAFCNLERRTGREVDGPDAGVAVRGAGGGRHGSIRRPRRLWIHDDGGHERQSRGDGLAVHIPHFTTTLRTVDLDNSQPTQRLPATLFKLDAHHARSFAGRRVANARAVSAHPRKELLAVGAAGGRFYGEAQRQRWRLIGRLRSGDADAEDRAGEERQRGYSGVSFGRHRPRADRVTVTFARAVAPTFETDVVAIDLPQRTKTSIATFVPGPASAACVQGEKVSIQLHPTRGVGVDPQAEYTFGQSSDGAMQSTLKIATGFMTTFH
jgi:hypothetical protein